jgi:hypothetical protein
VPKTQKRRNNAQICLQYCGPLQRSWLLSSTAMLLAGCLAFSAPVWAGDECGPDFTCDASDPDAAANYRFISQHYYLQPRLRLTYGHAWSGGFADGSGIVIDLKDADMLTGEAAARFGARLPPGSLISDLYLDAGLRHGFSNDTEAQVSNVTFADELPGTVGLVGGGLRASLLQDRLFLLLDTSYAKGADAQDFAASLSLTLNR